MKFPDVLKVQVIEQGTDLAVPSIALMLTLFAQRKNDYHFPVITREDGVATITVDDIKRSIAEDQKLFVMDYVSELEECKPELQIDVCTPDDIRRAVDAMETFKSVTKLPEGIIVGFRKSTNHLYHPITHRIELKDTTKLKTVDIFVETRN